MNFLTIDDLTADELEAVLSRATAVLEAVAEDLS